MMPTVHPNGMDIYYEVPGEGDPLVRIPYLAAGQACCAFQAAEYARHFGGLAADLRRARLSGKPDGTSLTELLAGDVAAFMQAARRGPRSCRGLSAAQRRVCGWKRSHLETGAGGLALTVKAWGALLMLCGPGQARDSSNGMPGQSCRVVQSSGRA